MLRGRRRRARRLVDGTRSGGALPFRRSASLGHEGAGPTCPDPLAQVRGELRARVARQRELGCDAGIDGEAEEEHA
jgi:hypothetical protein